MQATWKGRDCEIVEQQGHRYRLRWYSGTRNGEPRARYGWADVGEVSVLSPAAEACSVGRRGQWSQLQDVTEAARRVTGVRAGWEKFTNIDVRASEQAFRHVASGCVVVEWWKNPSWIRAYRPLERGEYYSDKTHIGATEYSTISAAMDAAEAWWEANKPKPAPEPKPADPDALPEGWETTDRNEQLQTARIRHIASQCVVIQWESHKEWELYSLNGKDFLSTHPTRAAAIAACEEWLKAQKPADPACKDCAEKEAEIARLTQDTERLREQIRKVEAGRECSLCQIPREWREIGAAQDAEIARLRKQGEDDTAEMEAEIARLTAERTAAAESLRLTCDELVRVKRERDSAERAAMEAVNEMRRCNNTSERDRHNTRANRWRNVAYMAGAAWLIAMGLVVSMVARAAGVVQ